jgi:hypothetical protein
MLSYLNYKIHVAVLVGKPMYFMEAALGQYGQVRVCPLFFRSLDFLQSNALLEAPKYSMRCSEGSENGNIPYIPHQQVPSGH